MDVTLVVDSLGPQLSGIGRYTWELCKRIPGEPGIDTVDFYRNGRFVTDPAVLLEGSSSPRQRNLLPRFIRKRLSRRRLASSLVHGTNFFLPPDAERGIITVHDLSVLRFPETHPPERLKAFERQLERSIDRAVHVITDTETVRRELLAEFSLSEDKVSAIHLGVDSRYREHSTEELRPPLGQLGLTPQAYALCVSTLEPRKKIAQLLRAWGNLPDHLRKSTPLALAGGSGWLNDALLEQIREAAEQGWLIPLGFVPEPLLPALYAGARLFCYPSTYEGFGLPPLESMASGVPAVVANRSCLPEVCGDAVAYVDPDDVAGFEQTLEMALSDRQWREKARSRGIERAAQFSWAECAERTAQLYCASAT